MPGLSVLFWNLNARPLEHRVGRLAFTYAVDVVCLAECDAPAGVLTAALSAVGRFVEADQSLPPLRVLHRLPVRSCRFHYADPEGRWLLYRVFPNPPAPEILLAVAHLPSKLMIRDTTQTLLTRPLVADIEAQEGICGHRRSVLVGDLNMNPFEEGVAGAGGLHGVMTAAVAARDERTVGGRPYPLFYNPMWGQFGDRTPGPPGTYYRSAAEAVNYFWNTYDQVLVRPELVKSLKSVEVLTHDGVESLLTKNDLPDRTNGSDHLPLLFRLEW
ncbi:MAG TPA: endonuclease/exonuclease/phosphatase family protein [Urbifossiella sp.]|nr:endonuclease/exonuclease/phosphatase family protein [Urbifossiella sp.]